MNEVQIKSAFEFWSNEPHIFLVFNEYMHDKISSLSYKLQV